MKLEGKTSFLTAVCMACLEGWTGGGIVCRFCLKAWTGGHLILGTMYSYDIFAAMPCCAERFKVTNCALYLYSHNVRMLTQLQSAYFSILVSHFSATPAINWFAIQINALTFSLTILKWFHVHHVVFRMHILQNHWQRIWRRMRLTSNYSWPKISNSN